LGHNMGGLAGSECLLSGVSPGMVRRSGMV
jgi:hypothetical protein